jgi:heat shock protein HslJ
MLAMSACGVGAQGKATPLENTHWRLTWMPGAKIDAATPRQAPYILLDPESRRVSGSGGCNRLMGGYELEGDRLRFTGTARTMMACANGMAVEDTFVKALESTREWKVSGGSLSLLDGQGQALARFAAAP